MDFLRALAPHHGNARHRAVAAVRSRYEADRPMQSVPSTMAADVDGYEHEVVPERPSIEASPSPVSPARLTAAYAETPEGAVRVTPGQFVLSVARPQQEPAPTDTQSAIDVPSSSKHVADALRAPVRDVVNERPRTAALVEPVTPDRARRPVASPALPIVSALASAARAPEGSGHEGPLSRQAVLARVEQPSERRPIVHVTIDRIDVRAPATAERAVPRTRPRPSSSNGTLTDYLRTRPPGRSGGAR